VLPAAHHAPLGPRDYVSFAIFGSSLALEVLADSQKSAWRAKKSRGEHDEKFIQSGLWAFSRHPKCVLFAAL
jgi:steroid 5-alpha reductase family enzyme